MYVRKFTPPAVPFDPMPERDSAGMPLSENSRVVVLCADTQAALAEARSESAFLRRLVVTLRRELADQTSEVSRLRLAMARKAINERPPVRTITQRIRAAVILIAGH